MKPADPAENRAQCNRILDRLEWFIENRWAEGRFIPNPATWLNSEIEDFQLSAPLSAARSRSGARTRAGACSAVLPWPSGSTGKASGDG